MHQKSPLRYTTQSVSILDTLMQETPSPTASCKGKGNYERVTLSAGSTIMELMIVRLGRGKTWHVMESYPTFDEFFFCKQRNILDELLGCFSINNWFDELFY